jgi:transcriptional regulator with XRE-family HTH domain
MNRIQEMLKKKGFSQNQLAVALGMSKSSISQYCSEKTDIPISRLRAISLVLNCEVADLIVSEPLKRKE